MHVNIPNLLFPELPENLEKFKIPIKKATSESLKGYGFLIDNAYVIDTVNDVEFFLSAVIYINKNEILNDDQYEYYELGLPFLAKLGKIIYNYELKREKAISPDFSRYLHKY